MKQVTQHDFSVILAHHQNIEDAEKLFYTYKEKCQARQGEPLPSYFILLGTKSIPPTSKLAKEKLLACITDEDLIVGIEYEFSKIFQAVEKKSEKEFCTIAFRALMYLNGISEECYIKLRSGRMLKIYSKGDVITREDVKRYASKDVHDLYILKETATWVMRVLSDFMPEIIEKIKESPYPQQVAERPRGVQEVTHQAPPPPTASSRAEEEEEVKVISVEKEVADIMKNQLKKVMGQIKKNPRLKNMLKKIDLNAQKDGYYKKHIQMLYDISCGLAREMDWATSASYEKLVACALVHDISLVDHGDYAKYGSKREIETDTSLTEEQRKMILNHPIESANIVRDLEGKVSAIPPGIDTIIEQHHELPDGKGFPRGLHANRIPPMSAIFIISQAIVKFFLANPKGANLKNFLQNEGGRYRGGNFSKIIAVIQRLS